MSGRKLYVNHDRDLAGNPNSVSGASSTALSGYRANLDLGLDKSGQIKNNLDITAVRGYGEIKAIS